jgi:hypothetical protein
MHRCPVASPLPRALQSGHWDREGQQRLVSLTAQVTAQAAQLAAAEERVRGVLVSTDGRGKGWGRAVASVLG